MLRRQSYMNKKKDKKSELEKTQTMIKQVIDKNLLESNKNEAGLKTHEDLPPNFNLVFNEKELNMITHFKNDID